MSCSGGSSLRRKKRMTKYVGSSFLVAVELIVCPFSWQLRDQIQALQAQLTQRPPIEAIQELRKEYSNLELILQGTQRENERAMTELERFVLTCHPCQINNGPIAPRFE
jgi:hypothetical protein